MDAGRLNRRLSILQDVLVDDGFTKTPGEPAVMCERACSATPVSDGERFRAGETQAGLSMRFVVRYDSVTRTITPEHSVLYEGRTLGILNVKEVGNREGIEISAAGRAEAPA